MLYLFLTTALPRLLPYPIYQSHESKEPLINSAKWKVFVHMFLMLMSETFGNLLVLPTSIPTPPKRRDVRLKVYMHVHVCIRTYRDACSLIRVLVMLWKGLCHSSSSCVRVWHWCFMVSFLCSFVWLTNFKRSPSSKKHHYQAAAQFQKTVPQLLWVCVFFFLGWRYTWTDG